ncbi:hypothetical protein [Metaclostridioides mangenotii]|uniref:hypothetical protein n=1 Tax=Metaclostridioides mangenotii TaxID=1540 RepID=UPI001F3F578D|nr:hypothetical protein [Clostridioides mangenotii]
MDKTDISRKNKINRSSKVRDIDEYKSKNKNNYKNRKGNKPRRKLPKFLIFVASFVIIILNLCGYAKISEMKYDIHYLEQDLRKKEITLDELETEHKKDKSITEVENNAKETLNMDYPKKEQIEYINLSE